MTLGDSVLDWVRIDLNKQLTAIKDKVMTDLLEIPANNTRTKEKMNRWLSQLDYIIYSLDKIESELTPKLERMLSYRFKDRELLSISLFQPSTKNLFLELQIHYCSRDEHDIDCNALSELILLSQVAQMLALLGDAAIDTAILHHIWKPKASDVGTLTQDRADLVSNEHLSKKCDEWDLYERRIHFDPSTSSKSEMEHDKGTLVEALYGVLYVESGFDRVRELVVHLL